MIGAAVVLVVVLWGGLAIYYGSRPTPPRRGRGCCEVCGHGQCAANGPCDWCVARRALQPRPRPRGMTDGSPYR